MSEKSRRSPTVRIGETTLTVRAPEVFVVGRMRHARRFAGRSMGLPEVRTLTIDPARGEASLSYRVPRAERAAWLARLAEAVGHDHEMALDDGGLPDWRDDEKITLSRVGGVVTRLRVIESKPDLLRFSAGEADRRLPCAVRRTIQALKVMPGVAEVVAEGIGGSTVTVRFDPARVSTASICRVAETELASTGVFPAGAGNPPEVSALANTTLGLGAVGELLLPVATPLAAGILVANKLNVVRDAAVQFGQGKVGLPLFDTALLTCSIVTGQVLAYALTDWSLHYWQRRWRGQVADETQRFLAQSLRLPEQSLRVGMGDDADRAVTVAQLAAGDRVRVVSGERVPADGRIIEGGGLVDDAVLGGHRTVVRRGPGNRVLAGSCVRAGELVFEVERTGPDTTAGRIAAAVVDVARGLPRETALQAQSERLAERTVVPTLATAGVGWVAGDLITVGAILHQDWISGPALAVPLLTLQQVREALHRGALVRHATALQRLSAADFVVFDGDDPALTAPGLELGGLESPLSDIDAVLRPVAGAGLYLGDGRTGALLDACRERGLAVRRPELLAFDDGSLVAGMGKHRIRLTDGAMPHCGVPDLLVDIDGHAVARLSFRLAGRPPGAEVLQGLRAAGMQTFVVSGEPEGRARELAQRLGADFSGGELDGAGTVRFLRGLRRRGIRPAYVGRLSRHPDLAASAHVAIDTDEVDACHGLGDVVMLDRSCDSLVSLVELARTYDPSLGSLTRKARVPNLLCVAGAFAGLLNGITAGLIANVGIMNVDRELRRRLDSRNPVGMSERL